MNDLSLDAIRIDHGTSGVGCVMQPEWDEAFAHRVHRRGDCLVIVGVKPDKNGYVRISYKGQHWWAHRLSLVLATGCEVPSPETETRHSCDNRPCIAPWHLQWGTRSENQMDCSSRGRHNKANGERNARAKLSDAAVASIRARVSAGARPIDLAVEHGVNRATISRIARGLWRKQG